MPHYKYFVTNNKMLLLPLLHPLQLIVILITNTLLLQLLHLLQTLLLLITKVLLLQLLQLTTNDCYASLQILCYR